MQQQQRQTFRKKPKLKVGDAVTTYKLRKDFDKKKTEK